MSESITLRSRITQWFKDLPVQQWFRGGSAAHDPLPLERQAMGQDEPHEPHLPAAPEHPQHPAGRFGFLRPWGKRQEVANEALLSLKQGFTTLADLMGSIRDNLEQQNQRQEQMISYLSHLPEVVQSIPEGQRIHGETLKAISHQLQRQVGQQEQLTEILTKVNETYDGQRRVIDNLSGQVSEMGGHNESISANLKQVGSAVENVGRNSEASAQALRQLSESLQARAGDTERLLQQQNRRTTTLLIVALALSGVALAASVLMTVLVLLRRG